MNSLQPDPPKWANRFLKWFCAPEILEEIQGDLAETYVQNIKRLGFKRAQRQYQLDVLRFFNFATIWGERNLRLHKIYFPMFRHYFRITRRLFIKNKLYILINTLGLGITISCCIAVYLLIAYNIEFDDFHRADHIDRIFKVHTLFSTRLGEQLEANAAPMPFAPEARETIAGIDHYTRYITNGGFVISNDQGFSEQIAFADSAFLDMFNFPLMYGSKNHFKDKHRIFLSYELAQKIFDKSNPTGQTLMLHFENEKVVPVIVGGVMKKVPSNSTFVFDALIRIENYLDIHDLKPDDWAGWRDPNTFFQLNHRDHAAKINNQFKQYIPIRNQAKKDIDIQAFQLMPFDLRSVREDADNISTGYVNSPINAAPLFVFSTMAIMILLIACFNLTNTSIALSTKRLKEIGIRKAVGAARKQIIAQFLCETVLVMSLSLVVAMLLSWWLVIPEFQAMFSFDFGVSDLSGINFLLALIMLMIVSSLIAGAYPALFNSRLHPAALVKGKIKIKGTNWLTRILTTAQFALTVIFLIAGVVFFQNIQFQENIGFGYERDRLMMVNISEEKTYEVLKNEINSNPKIRNIGVGYSHVGYSSWQAPIEIENQTYNSRVMGIGENYLETVGLALLNGTPLDESNDADREEKVLVNRAFLKRTALENPIDRIIQMEGSKRRIVGVVQNHLDNIHMQVDVPFIFYLIEPEKYRTMVINTGASDLAETFKYVQETWQTLFPDRPFEAKLQEEVLLGRHREFNTNMGKIFLFLTVLGIVMSIAGIYSLASLNIARRTKEIGIRKILGASKRSIVRNLNREFVMILVISVMLGAIAGYLLTEILLTEIYLHHITVGFVPVILCALLIFGAGYFTTSRSILEAADRNPMDALQIE